MDQRDSYLEANEGFSKLREQLYLINQGLGADPLSTPTRDRRVPSSRLSVEECDKIDEIISFSRQEFKDIWDLSHSLDGKIWGMIFPCAQALTHYRMKTIRSVSTQDYSSPDFLRDYRQSLDAARPDAMHRSFFSNRRLLEDWVKNILDELDPGYLHCTGAQLHSIDERETPIPPMTEPRRIFFEQLKKKLGVLAESIIRIDNVPEQQLMALESIYNICLFPCNELHFEFSVFGFDGAFGQKKCPIPMAVSFKSLYAQPYDPGYIPQRPQATHDREIKTSTNGVVTFPQTLAPRFLTLLNPRYPKQIPYRLAMKTNAIPAEVGCKDLAHPAREGWMQLLLSQQTKHPAVLPMLHATSTLWDNATTSALSVANPGKIGLFSILTPQGAGSLSELIPRRGLFALVCKALKTASGYQTARKQPKQQEQQQQGQQHQQEQQLPTTQQLQFYTNLTQVVFCPDQSFEQAAFVHQLREMLKDDVDNFCQGLRDLTLKLDFLHNAQQSAHLDIKPQNIVGMPVNPNPTPDSIRIGMKNNNDDDNSINHENILTTTTTTTTTTAMSDNDSTFNPTDVEELSTPISTAMTAIGDDNRDTVNSTNGPFNQHSFKFQPPQDLDEYDQQQVNYTYHFIDLGHAIFPSLRPEHQSSSHSAKLNGWNNELSNHMNVYNLYQTLNVRSDEMQQAMEIRAQSITDLQRKIAHQTQGFSDSIPIYPVWLDHKAQRETAMETRCIDDNQLSLYDILTEIDEPIKNRPLNEYQLPTAQSTSLRSGDLANQLPEPIIASPIIITLDRFNSLISNPFRYYNRSSPDIQNLFKLANSPHLFVDAVYTNGGHQNHFALHSTYTPLNAIQLLAKYNREYSPGPVGIEDLEVVDRMEWFEGVCGQIGDPANQTNHITTIYVSLKPVVSRLRGNLNGYYRRKTLPPGLFYEDIAIPQEFYPIIYPPVSQSFAFNPLDTICGTLLYASPELFTWLMGLSRVPIDPFQTDLYSLGLVFYIFTFGSNPFVTERKVKEGTEHRLNELHDKRISTFCQSVCGGGGEEVNPQSYLLNILVAQFPQPSITRHNCRTGDDQSNHVMGLDTSQQFGSMNQTSNTQQQQQQEEEEDPIIAFCAIILIAKLYPRLTEMIGQMMHPVPSKRITIREVLDGFADVFNCWSGEESDLHLNDYYRLQHQHQLAGLNELKQIHLNLPRRESENEHEIDEAEEGEGQHHQVEQPAGSPLHGLRSRQDLILAIIETNEAQMALGKVLDRCFLEFSQEENSTAKNNLMGIMTELMVEIEVLERELFPDPELKRGILESLSQLD